jgi:two-component system chemotaxis sensor kinase CheA
MSDFDGMEELLGDFLTEASEMLSDVDNKLVDLEKRPDDKALLNDIFRGFHTIKGGAGFLNAEHLVALCHRTENLFDKLRNGELKLQPEIMDTILAATGVVKHMFGALAQKRQPGPAEAALLAALDAVIAGEVAMAAKLRIAEDFPSAAAAPASSQEPDWQGMYQSILGQPTASTPQPAQSLQVAAPASAPLAPLNENAVHEPAPARMQHPTPAQGQQPITKETTIRIDTVRLDQVLNLSGEIGLTKNRLNCLKADIVQGKADGETLKAFDEAVSQLDLLVGDLQNAVMKTRMQPIGRLFQKYPRLARDLARQLGKDVELVISGEETELDKTMIEDLNDPLVHLVRNAVDHGVETMEERTALGKPTKSLVSLSATQVGDHIIIEVSDDGKGMRPDALRRKAVEKGAIDLETANSMDDKQSLNLVFLPGFSTKDEISAVSGRGVGMDVVKTNIQRLNGRIDVTSVPGQGSTFSISLPLTLAILPVLVVRLGTQPFAIPLSMVREIIPIAPKNIQRVSGKPTLVVREEILPIKSLAALINWPQDTTPAFGVLMQAADTSFVLAVDGFVGRDDVVIKPLSDIKPKGIAGATLSGDGAIVLVLDMEELLLASSGDMRSFAFAEAV